MYQRWIKNDFKFDSLLEGIEFYVLDKNDEIVKASKCYIGEEYGNLIGQNILSNIPGIHFLHSINEFGIDDTQKEIFVSFLTELKISKFPKITKKEISNPTEIKEYSAYNAQKFPKINTRRNETFDYDTFFKHGGRIVVYDVEQFENILTKCKFEDIICWFLSDKEMCDHLASENELDSKSFMLGKPANKREFREVDHSQMRSYLRKTITEVPWINTNANFKTDIYSCVIKPQNIYPVINELKVEYDYINSIFKRNCKKEVEFLFTRLGMAEDISELNKEKIYEILLTLPEKDKDCNIGKKIYAQLNLAFSSEEVNKLTTDNKKYEEFKKDGKVLAEYNGHFEYKKNSEVYYVDKKIYSDDILSSFPKLAISRRSGELKNKAMFCVKSIKDIGNVEVHDVKFHMLNEEYQKEFKQILPYIYVKRLRVDNKTGKELNILKTSNINLVTSAKTTCINNGINNEGTLKNYEAIYTERKAYVKIPSCITCLEELKSEVKFTYAIAEVISTMLDVDSDKDSFINIVRCNSIADIEEYFKQNDDDNLTLVKLAKEKFNGQINYEDEFIKSIAQASTRSVEDVKEVVKKYNIYYPNLNDDNTFKQIINLFYEMNIDVSEYNYYGSQFIDLRPYYKDEFENLKNKYKDRFFHYTLKKIFDENGTIDDFSDIKEKYLFGDFEFKNSVKLNIKEMFKSCFCVSIEELDKESSNYHEFLDRLEVNDSKNKSVNSEIKIETTTNTTENGAIDFAKLNLEIRKEVDNEELFSDLRTTVKRERKNKCAHQKRTYSDESNFTKQLVGFTAESVVYNKLLKMGKNDVEWKSENAKKATVIAKGDDTLGYDIRYRDEKGSHFVEVKGSKSSNSEFNLTKNEYDFGVTHKDNFEIWFVSIDEEMKPSRVYSFGNIFAFKDGQSFFNNDNFTVEFNEFKIRPKVKSE